MARFGLIAGLFLTSCTQLVGFQLDKALMTISVGLFLGHFYLARKAVPRQTFLILILAFIVMLASYLVNLPDSSLIIFFPIIGLTYVSLLGSEERFLDLFYWALFLHIGLGVVLVLISYLIGLNPYVHPMYDKGLPFLHAAKGFTTTVQAFGTLVISWFLIFYWKKQTNPLSFWDRIAYGIVFVGLLLTFNRNSFLVFYLIVFFKHKRIFWSTIVAGLVLYVYFFDFVNQLLFNLSTISSRADLLQAFRISFFQHTDWLGYLIGHGNNMVEEGVARSTVYRTGYIENGTSVLLYTYGFVGYLAYLIAVLGLSLAFFLKENGFLAALFFYVFIVAQQFTHEYFSTTIYLQLAVFILIFNQTSNREG